MPIYRFRDCYLNTAERRVVKNGLPVKMTPKTLDMLQLLVENHGVIVSKDEILGQVWNGSFIEEGNISVHISNLRRLCGEKNRMLIETIPGIGYRFVAPINEANKHEWDEHSKHTTGIEEKSPDNPFLDSIAVLPLVNISDDPEIEYLVDGLTESFINNLSYISGLKVLGRNTVFRYKDKAIDANKIGEALGVAIVLTGRLRAIRDSITISVELTQVSTEKQLWGGRFTQPFSEMIEMQETIIAALSEKIRAEIVKVAGETHNRSMTQNAESYRLYLKGMHFIHRWSITDVNRSIEQFQLSIFHDPRNFHSYLRIVQCYMMQYSLEQISYQEAIRRIQPHLPLITELRQTIDRDDEIFEVVIGLKTYLEWNFEESLKHFERAVRINPSNCDARRWCSNYLSTVGRMAEALEQSKQILKIDPLSVRSYNSVSKVYYKMRQYENAVQYVRESLELSATQSESLAVLGIILSEMGEYDEAIEFINKALDVEFNIEYYAMLGYIQARAGRVKQACEVLDRFDAMEDSHIPAVRRAIIYGALGEMETAFRYLEESFHQHEVEMCMLKVDPRFDSFRTFPQFRDLMRRVGLPQ